MEDYLRYGLLTIAGLILLFMLFEAWLSRRRLHLSKRNSSAVDSANDKSVLMQTAIEPSYSMNSSPTKNQPTQQTVSASSPSENDFIILSVFAKPNSQFASYDLFQAISATGMQFGEMNIFHYYHSQENQAVKLFSLASATKPGDFNLDKIGDFSCSGLTLFIDLRAVTDPELAFEKMLKTAEQLADDLDGNLFAGHKKPWTAELFQQYQQSILQYKALNS